MILFNGDDAQKGFCPTICGRQVTEYLPGSLSAKKYCSEFPAGYYIRFNAGVAAGLTRNTDLAK
jgi:hypothetical protein